MIALLLFSCFTIQAEEPTYLVFSGGQVMEILGEPRFEGKFVYFTQTNGDKGMLPADRIDRDKTQTYNDQIRTQREAAAAEREAMAQAAPKETEHKVISIDHAYQIPRADSSSNRSTGSVESSTSGGEQPIENPVIQNFSSDEGIYMAQEIIRRYADHYEVECRVAVNDARGFRNIQLGVTAVFDNGTRQKLTVSVTPDSIGRGESGTAVIRLTEQARLMTTEYMITGEMGATN